MLQLTTASGCGFQFGSPNKEDGERGKDEPERGIRYIIQASSPLFAIKTQLEQNALGRYHAVARSLIPPSPHPLPPFQPLPESTYKWLRQHYLHLSWYDRLGFECRLDKQNVPTRLVIAG